MKRNVIILVLAGLSVLSISLASCHAQKNMSGSDTATPPIRENRDSKQEKRDWINFYKYYFNQKVNLDSLNLPQLSEDQFYLIIPAGMTVPRVIEAAEYSFDIDNQENIGFRDSPLRDIRTPSKTYAIVLTKSEAIVDSLSAINGSREVTGMTLLEYLILEFRYFTDNNQHLKGLSICCGSHGPRGMTIGVNWNRKALEIRELSPDLCGLQLARGVYSVYVEGNSNL